nr:hypothetical protein Y105C5A.m - Caenorhabditis elegans [Caenorhabditis elegans]
MKKSFWHRTAMIQNFSFGTIEEDRDHLKTYIQTTTWDLTHPSGEDAYHLWGVETRIASFKQDVKEYEMHLTDTTKLEESLLNLPFIDRINVTLKCARLADLVPASLIISKKYSLLKKRLGKYVAVEYYQNIKTVTSNLNPANPAKNSLSISDAENWLESRVEKFGRCWNQKGLRLLSFRFPPDTAKMKRVMNETETIYFDSEEIYSSGNDYKTAIVPIFDPECGKVAIVRGVHKMKNFLCNDPRLENAYVWAHNGGRYDHVFTLEKLLKELISLSKIKMSGLTFVSVDVPITKKNVLHFRDSAQFLKMRLEEMPKAFSLKAKSNGYFPYLFNHEDHYGLVLPHLPAIEYYEPTSMKPESREKFEQWYNENYDKPFDFDEEIQKYCQMDVQILTESMIKFTEFCTTHLSRWNPLNNWLWRLPALSSIRRKPSAIGPGKYFASTKSTMLAWMQSFSITFMTRTLR